MDPATGGLAKVTVRPIDPLRIQRAQLRNTRVVSGLFMNAAQDAGRIDSLAQHPVHASIHNRAPIPVSGVNETFRAVFIPAIRAGTVEKLLSSFKHPIFALPHSQ